MWLLTTFGFFSIVEKPGDRAAGTLTVRARVRGDIESLRTKYLPGLGEIQDTPDADYAFRARVAKPELAAAMGHIVLDIHYANFKSQVAERMGYAREQVYHEVWETLAELQQQPVRTK